MEIIIFLVLVTLGLTFYTFILHSRQPKEELEAESRLGQPLARKFHFVPYIFLALCIITIFRAPNINNRNDRAACEAHANERFLAANQRQLKCMAGYLRSGKKATGKYPSNENGPFIMSQLALKNERKDPFWRDVLYTKDIDRNLVPGQDAPLLSEWGEPLIYENRNGLPPELFSNSGATNDAGRNYSAEVDNGIYLWTLGGQQAYDNYSRWHKHRASILRLGIFFGLLYVLSSFSFILLMHMQTLYQKRLLWSFVRDSLLAFIILGFAGSSLGSVESCYIPARTAERTPELTNDYLALMQKYHEQGIIQDATYVKLKKALGNGS